MAAALDEVFEALEALLAPHAKSMDIKELRQLTKRRLKAYRDSGSLKRPSAAR